jgi:hypothetical protein
MKWERFDDQLRRLAGRERFLMLKSPQGRRGRRSTSLNWFGELSRRAPSHSRQVRRDPAVA